MCSFGKIDTMSSSWAENTKERTFPSFLFLFDFCIAHAWSNRWMRTNGGRGVARVWREERRPLFFKGGPHDRADRDQIDFLSFGAGNLFGEAERAMTKTNPRLWSRPKAARGPSSLGRASLWWPVFVFSEPLCRPFLSLHWLLISLVCFVLLFLRCLNHGTPSQLDPHT